jgi:hypothetical protein
MITNQQRTQVEGIEEQEVSLVKKEGRFLIFKTQWWEQVSTKHIGNDIYINTDNPIRKIILNGREINPNQ